MNKKLGEYNLTLSSNDIKKVDVLQSRAAICAGSFFWDHNWLENVFHFFFSLKHTLTPEQFMKKHSKSGETEWEHAHLWFEKIWMIRIE